MKKPWLVAGLEHGFYTFLKFSPRVGMMIQSDELIFFMGVAQPPSRWEFCVIAQMYRIKGHMKQTKMMVSHTVF